MLPRFALYAVALIPAALTLAGARPEVWVVDGDTIDVRGERIRIANLDAPDVGSHAKCALEAQRGQLAKSAAIAHVRAARNVGVADRQGRDRYGRILARVTLDGADFGARMIEGGHGRPWRGRSSDWCA